MDGVVHPSFILNSQYKDTLNEIVNNNFLSLRKRFGFEERLEPRMCRKVCAHEADELLKSSQFFLCALSAEKRNWQAHKKHFPRQTFLFSHFAISESFFSWKLKFLSAADTIFPSSIPPWSFPLPSEPAAAEKVGKQNRREEEKLFLPLSNTRIGREWSNGENRTRNVQLIPSFFLFSGWLLRIKSVHRAHYCRSWRKKIKAK